MRTMATARNAIPDRTARPTWVAGALLATMLLAAAPPAAAAAAPTPPPNSCISCHADLPDPLNVPVEGMKTDIHAAKGLSCADCHGGDPTDQEASSMAREKGFRGAPKPAEIPAFCGRCHADEAYMRRFDPKLPTDQLSQYWSSVHGQRLKKGDQKVATCVSCHGVHGILPPDRADSPIFPANVPETCGHCHANPEYMAEYKIPTDQLEQYKHSVHGDMVLVQRDFSAPVCNTCHGNHGAYPPGVTSIAGVCGQCHVNNATFFNKSPHKPAFDKLALPECVTCHSNHGIQRTTDAMLGGQKGAVCRRCHEPGTPGYTAAVSMHDGIEHLKRTMTDTRTMLAKASAMGMEVSDELYSYRQDVRPQLIKVRTETHLGNAAAVLKMVQDGIKTADAGETAAKATLAEAQARRRHLLVPLGLIALLMGLLYAKLRQLEGRGTNDRR